MYVDSLRNKYPMVQAKVNYNVSITLCRRQLASANKKNKNNFSTKNSHEST